MGTTWARASRLVVTAVVVAATAGSFGRGRPADTKRVVVSRMTYRGWAGALRLSNGDVELVVVPTIGRIMRFAATDGSNVLWENPELWGREAPRAEDRREWTNFGGDKVWPAPQERWSWPPDPWLDGSPHRCTVQADGSVRLVSPISRVMNLRLVRTVRMEPSKPVVVVDNVLENHGAEPVSWSVWEVAQVESPDRVEMPRSSRLFDTGYRIFPDSSDVSAYVTVAGDIVHARRNSRGAYKVGADCGRAVVSAVRSGWRFTMIGPARARGEYPDGGCNVEVYSNPDPLPYMELEVLGPMVTIPPRGSIALRTTWKLERIHFRE